MFFSGQFNYVNTFNKVHNLSAMLIASGFQQSKSGQYHKNSSANLAFDASYNYAQKYYADFGLAAIHSAQLAPGHREALSPSLSLGWRLKNESFLKNSKVVDDMMVSVSGSIINEDIDIAMVTIATISIRVFGLLITAMDGMMDLAINTPIQKR